MLFRQARAALIAIAAMLAAAAAPSAAADYAADAAAEMKDAFDALLSAEYADAASVYAKLFKSDPKSPVAEYCFLRLLQCSGPGGKEAAAELDDIKTLVRSGEGQHLLKALLLWMAAGESRGKGELDKAEEALKKLGLVRSYSFLGPYENEGETGFAAEYDVEADLKSRKDFPDMEKVFDGKAGKVRWNTPPMGPPTGAIDLNHVYRESENVSGYVMTFLYASAPCDVALRTGSDGAMKIWLNGAILFEGDTYRSPRLDQDAIGARLEAGWNEVIAKVCHKKGPWRLIVRVTNPDGSPIEGLKADAAPWASDPGARPAPRAAAPHKRPEVYGGARAYFDSLIQKGDDSAMTVARWAWTAMQSDALDENDRSPRDRLKAVVAKTDHPYLRILLSHAIPERNLAMEELRKAVKLAEDRPLPYFEISRLYAAPRPIESYFWFFTIGGEDAAATQEEYAKIREVEIWEKEEEYLNRTLALAPGFLPAEINYALLFCRKAGMRQPNMDPVRLSQPWALEAKAKLAKLLERSPDNKPLRRILESLTPRTPAAMIDLCAGYVKEDNADSKTRLRLVDLLVNAGRLKEALLECGNELLLSPYNTEIASKMADLLRALDDYAGAAGMYESALRICPDNVALLQGLAECRLVAGDREGAAALFRKALEIKPQLADVSRRLKHLGPKTADFWTAYKADLGPVVEAARKASDFGKEDAVCFLKNDVILVNENGTSKMFTQKVIKILTEKGRRDYNYVSAYPSGLDYWAAATGEVKTAKIIKPDGTEVEGQWWDNSTYASFDDLKAGDIVVFECKIEEVGEARYKGYFGLMLLLQDEFIPFRESRVTFLHNKDKKMYFQAVKCPSEPKVAAEGDVVSHTWTLRDIPEVKEEWGMPVIFELCPFVHASTFGTWAEISDWFLGLCRDQFETCDILDKAVLSVVKDLKTDEEKVDALFKYLVSEIRYESLSLADHSFRPFKACKTFQRKYGDCKDTAALMVTMLKIAGIKANLVLVRAGRGDKLDLELPSMHIFNHCIAYVPGLGPKGLFLDCTARYCGSRELPSMDQGAVAMVAAEGGAAQALYLPYDPPEANLVRLVCKATINADGSAKLDTRARIVGQEAYRYRSEYQEGSKRILNIEKEYNWFFKSVKAKSIDFSDLSDYNKPVEYSAEFDIPALARTEKGGLVLRGSLFAFELCRSLAQTDTRYHDLIMDYPFRHEREVVLTIPEGLKFESVPQDWKNESEFASFSLAFKKISGTSLRITAAYTLKASRVKRDDYPKLRSFAVACDKAESAEIVITKQ